MKNLLVLVVFVVLLTAAALAQTEKGGVIPTGNGVLVVSNEPGNYYTIEIKGKKVTTTNHRLRFDVDGRFLNIQTTAKPIFLTGSKDLDDKAILQQHVDWQFLYFSDAWRKRFGPQTKMVIATVWHNLPNDTLALEWTADAPVQISKPSSRKYFNVQVVKRDHVFSLYSELADGDDENALRQFLLDTIATLKHSDKPLPFDKAGEMVRKGS